MKKSVKFLIALAVTFVVAFLMFYLMVPALNIFSEEFWVLLAVLAWKLAPKRL